jgi:hypothetical protein
MRRRGGCTVTKPEDTKEELIVRLGRDHRLAHEALFSHRHPDGTPDFHYEMIDDLHNDELRRLIELGFRGCAKSTRAEEALVIKAAWQRFRNAIIICENQTRAIEHLSAIKYELDFNENLRDLFGDLHGPTWNEDKIEMSNGRVIQAFGRGQSLRGTKEKDIRPDFCLIDDLEDEESVSEPHHRDKTQRYVMKTVIPALAPGARVVILGNMLDPDCLIVRLRKTGRWMVKEYPWEHIDPETGERRATWPSRFPLEFIDETKAEFEQLGMLNEYQQEYMVQAADPSTRVFTSAMIKVEPTVRRWEPTYAFYDPARTVKASSAHTGKVVFSWVGPRLIVWEGDGQLWMPDKIIDDMFATSSIYAPIEIGVERDGLEEFLLQPLRAEQTKRQDILPIKPMKAPVGKLAFIRSLQPFFSAGEVIFAKDLPVLKQQLLSFPTGRIDVPNALAYALRMRPGLPIYENFTHRNVVEDLAVLRSAQVWLAVHATRQYTCAALLQVAGTSLHVLADWVREGDPGNTLADIFAEAQLLAGKTVKAFAPPQHWQGYDTIGLQPAARKLKQRVNMGGDPVVGREEIRKKIDALSHGHPSLQVSSAARWTMNAFAGGYARSVKAGSRELFGVADDGPYKTLMEAVEAFAAIGGGALERDGEDRPNYGIDSQGRRYLSARANHRG